MDKSNEMPVAWAVYNGWSRICFYMTEEDARDHAQKAQKNHDLSGSLAAFRVVPLYTAPQPPAQAHAREGLTDEQREAIERAVACLELSELSAERAISDDLRALLAAHPARPEPRAEVTDTVRVPARVLDLLNIINRDGVLKRASELQEVYRLIGAVRVGEAS
ncbi:TPA: hypothetical protein SAO13_003717 [Burkholderia multivorans]|uniref:hypothetical protein n=1 Tax=Burkholderia multivorans TaxID=87883 RepID=UPI001C23C80A|nr:hypothetical protein [Burkholderia multivorans]MBU9241008.1 hypothetical protein [Burkholderia multivorans]HEF4749713.1 hypothetical protein [Burkholderia multivorans]